MRARLPFLLLCILLLFLGLNALAGGAMLMLSPGGELLGMDRNWLLETPFSSYFLPGLLLFLFLGLFSVLGCIGLLWPGALSLPERLNLFQDKHWAWSMSLYSGLIAIVWIIVQQGMTPYFWLQSLILGMGWSIVVLCLLPAIQERCKKRQHHN